MGHCLNLLLQNLHFFDKKDDKYQLVGFTSATLIDNEKDFNSVPLDVPINLKWTAILFEISDGCWILKIPQAKSGMKK